MRLHLSKARSAGVVVARLVVAAISIYLLVVAREFPSLSALDHPSLFVVAGAAGVFYAALPGVFSLRWIFVVALTFTAYGRAMALAFIGAEYLTTGQEVASVLSWFVVWTSGLLGALVLTAEKLLERG